MTSIVSEVDRGFITRKVWGITERSVTKYESRLFAELERQQNNQKEDEEEKVLR
jgi:hypothetical protein